MLECLEVQAGSYEALARSGEVESTIRREERRSVSRGSACRPIPGVRLETPGLRWQGLVAIAGVELKG